MSKKTNLQKKQGFLLIALLCGASYMVQANEVAVLAPVVAVMGSVIGTSGGFAKSGPLRAGESLAEGSAIRTGLESRVLLVPVPGTAVSESKETSASLSRLSVTKNDGAIQKRDAVLGLDIGTLSFSLEKRDASITSFAVGTPSGIMNARGSVGTITVIPPCVKVVSLSGKISFIPNLATIAQSGLSTETASSSTSPNSPLIISKAAIIIPPGCFLAICGEGDHREIRLINTIAGTRTNFNGDGTAGDTRAATVQELESTRGFFEAALVHMSLAVSYGLLSSEGAAEVTAILMKINQSFATLGIKPIQAPAIGSRANGGRNKSSDGIIGGTLNPANTLGEVISREK